MSRFPALTRRLLLIVDPAEFEKEVLRLSQEGAIDRQYLDWLEDCADGKRGCGIDSTLVRLLHGELKRLVWIAPEMPTSISSFYEEKIAEALDPVNVYTLERVLIELKEKSLMTVEFCHLFHRALDVRVDRHDINLLSANSCWDILLEVAGPEIAKEVDF